MPIFTSEHNVRWWVGGFDQMVIQKISNKWLFMIENSENSCRGFFIRVEFLLIPDWAPYPSKLLIVNNSFYVILIIYVRVLWYSAHFIFLFFL